MKAVAIRKGQAREKVAGFREMGTLRVTVAARNFSLVTIQHSRIRGLLKDKQVGSKKVLAEEHERDKKHADRVELPE